MDLYDDATENPPGGPRLFFRIALVLETASCPLPMAFDLWLHDALPTLRGWLAEMGPVPPPIARLTLSLLDQYAESTSRAHEITRAV